jgi:hypothetical protein
MALLFTESFDGFGTIAGDGAARLVNAGKWTSYAVADISLLAAAARTGGAGLRFLNTQGRMIHKGLTPATPSEGVVGWAFRGTGLSIDYFSIFNVWSPYVESVPHLRVYTRTDGSIHVWRRDNTYGTLVGNSAAGVISNNAWAYLEMKFLIHGTTGTCTFKVNNTTVFNVTGANTAYGAGLNWTGIRLADMGGVVGVNNDYDDIYACDTSGTINNTFLGPIRVGGRFMSTGNGANTGFTPNAGTDRGANVRDAGAGGHDSDTTYNSTTTVGNKDTYVVPASALSGDVLAVQSTIIVRSDGSGGETVCPVYRIAGTDYDGANKTVGNSYLALSEIKELSPATGAPWTLTELQQLGLKLVA